MSARWVQYGHEWCQEMQNCQENLKIKSKYYILKIHINGIIEKLWKYHHSLQSTVRTLKKPSLGTIFSEILTRFPRAPRPWDIPRIMSYPTHLTYPVDLVLDSCADARVLHHQFISHLKNRNRTPFGNFSAFRGHCWTGESRLGVELNFDLIPRLEPLFRV